MLSCHLDAVDIGDPDGWRIPPFEGRIEDGFLHGRGAMDIKGPLALQTFAAATFVERRPAGDLLVAHTVLEERGGWGMESLLEAGEVSPGAVIIGEATAGDLCVGHRGRAELIVELRGLAGHASAPERARNPLDLAGPVLDALRTLAGSLESDPVLGPSTLAPTAVETLPRSRNVIPDRVRIVLDWRVLPDVTPESAVRRVADHLRAHVTVPDGFGLEVRPATELQHTWTGRAEERRLFTPGFLLATDHPVTIAAAAAIRSTTGREPRVRPWTFATDGGHSCGVHGIPTVGFAPGEERHAHTDTERLDLAEARVAFEAYPALISAVQAASRQD
jgi:putative selenium metabolism hydrolase